ncbi:MAG: hypothetical protein DRI26_02865 [Chloroflexi bacterium]|nr:MAG: hypothetical protein DRI26_02865 [Chloroflexota bacterium]
MSRGVDYAQGWERPFKRSQDYVAHGLAFGSAYAHSRVTTPASKDIARGVFQSDITLVMEGLADKVFGPPEERFTARRRVVAQPRAGAPALEAPAEERATAREVRPAIVDEELLT